MTPDPRQDPPLVVQRVALALREHADYLDNLPPGGEALRGPYWYREGVHAAADLLRDRADRLDGTPAPTGSPDADTARQARVAELAATLTRGGADQDTIDRLISAVAEQTGAAIDDARLLEPILRWCVVPGCLREFDTNASMNGRTPARPEWAYTGWRLLHCSGVHPAGGYVCPTHADAVAAHTARRTNTNPGVLVQAECTCGAWSTDGLGIHWHGAARGLWEQHLLEELGAFA
ncbi:hypothetical protein [Streptomyces sp.]|uniref:hypothetical protein n=1 Tax=Streptomyces sp. TaxID=1931 RepID=UPI002F3F9292